MLLSGTFPWSSCKTVENNSVDAMNFNECKGIYISRPETSFSSKILTKVQLFKLDGTRCPTICLTKTISILEIITKSSCDKSERNGKEKMVLILKILRIICKVDLTDDLSENATLHNPSILQKCQSQTTVLILESIFYLSNNLY